MEDRIKEIIITILIIAYAFAWHQNNVLRATIKSCGDKIDIANYSIGYANNEISKAKNQSNSNFQTMQSTLSDLQGQYPQQLNPCSEEGF